MKLLAIISLTLAVANPLCCCDHAMLLEKMAGDEPVPVRGCCGGGTDGAPSQPVQDEQHHNRDQCPHQQGNGYKQASSSDLKHQDFEVIFPALPQYDLLEAIVDVPVAGKGRSTALDKVSLRGPPRLHQYYCAYLL